MTGIDKARRQFLRCPDLADMEFGAEMSGSYLVVIMVRYPAYNRVSFACHEWSADDFDARPMMRRAADSVRELLENNQAEVPEREYSERMAANVPGRGDS